MGCSICSRCCLRCIRCCPCCKSCSPCSRCCQPEDDNILKELIRSYPIVIFSDTQCIRSYETKKLLDEVGADYAVVELNLCDNGWYVGKKLFEYTGIPTIPQVFIRNTFVGGACDIERYLHTGELQRMIKGRRPYHDRNEKFALPNCRRPYPPRCLHIPRHRMPEDKEEKSCCGNSRNKVEFPSVQFNKMTMM